MRTRSAAVIVVGGGLAGISAAIYLARAKRETLVIDSGRSMARWEPDVQNYLGFPSGVPGDRLVSKGRTQARRFGAKFQRDEILSAGRKDGHFVLKGKRAVYRCERLLLATGIFHIPPDIQGIKPCLGHSLFFCKDCDGFRVQRKAVGIYGWSNETVEYALGMLFYSSCVAVVTDGREPRWDEQHAEWLRHYEIPVYPKRIVGVTRSGTRLQALNYPDDAKLLVDVLFTTRGDIYFNKLAKQLGAETNEDGEVVVNLDMHTTVQGLYAAGCVTPANCQMIIAAGQGATAAQAINRDLFVDSLKTHKLRRVRQRQVASDRIRPVIRVKPPAS
ncbi:MAG TPA: NAD(P)/FAD-dependent oxidoreductase [Verrucomicrobiae bacterium]|nr:NAD(P)/FAD-dependent oxidoreductase [Verrucomicrobiae bacterium]